MKNYFDSITLKSLHIFRMIFLIFLAFLLVLIITQIYNDANISKEEIATEFSEQVRTIDLKLIEIEKELKLTSRLIEIDLNLSKKDILTKFSSNQNEKNAYYLDEKKWEVISYENISTMTKPQLNTLSSLLSTGLYIPLHLDLDKYQAITFTVNNPKTTLIYPYFFEKNLSTSLNSNTENNQSNIADGLTQLIKNDSIKSKNSEGNWILPHKSLFNNIDAIGIAIPMYSKKDRKELGYVYTDIAVEQFHHQLEIMQNIEANIMLTMSDGKKNHIVNSSFPLKNNNENKFYLSRESVKQIPLKLAEALSQTPGWVTYDEDGYFLISVPLSNPLFRLTFFTRSKNFYLVNSDKSISKIYIFIFVLFFGMLLDVIIRRKFLQPLLISNEKLTIEKEHLKDTHFELEKVQNILFESEKLALIGQLVASISSEIIIPLKRVIVDSKIKQEILNKLINSDEIQQPTSRKTRHLINDVANNHEQTCNDLENVLDICESLNQISADKSLSHIETINIGKYIEKSLKSIAPEMKKRKVHILFSFVQDYQVTTYPSGINQVLINLIFNAALHAYDKNIGGDIHVKVFKQDENIGISITDFGKGINEKTQQKIFIPFYTTKESKRGTGVGLNICKDLIENTLKGTLKLQTSVGQGSCFTVIIPENLSTA